MERAIALKRLRKIFGKDFGYQINPKAPSDEERAAAQAVQAQVAADRKAAGDALSARMRHLLDNDAEYQELLKRSAAARKAQEENTGILLTRKISVGTVNGLFFRVAAEANSWEDIFTILKRQGKGV